MKPITTFLLGIAFTLLISATTVSIITVKPAQSKTTTCFTSFSLEDTQPKILEYARKGFIVKNIVANPISDGRNRILVVMEKY